MLEKVQSDFSGFKSSQLWTLWITDKFAETFEKSSVINMNDQ